MENGKALEEAYVGFFSIIKLYMKDIKKIFLPPQYQ